jgi:hypothetical protein
MVGVVVACRPQPERFRGEGLTKSAVLCKLPYVIQPIGEVPRMRSG